MPPLPAAIPGGVADLVAELTAKDPAARPASAASVAARAGQLRAAIARYRHDHYGPARCRRPSPESRCTTRHASAACGRGGSPHWPWLCYWPLG